MSLSTDARGPVELPGPMSSLARALTRAEAVRRVAHKAYAGDPDEDDLVDWAVLCDRVSGYLEFDLGQCRTHRLLLEAVVDGELDQPWPGAAAFERQLAELDFTSTVPVKPTASTAEEDVLAWEDVLDEAHASLLREVLSKAIWSRTDLDLACRARRLLIDGAVDVLNETALELNGSILFTATDPLAMDPATWNELRA